MLSSVESSTLGECSEWASGGTPSKSNAAFWTGSIPWVSAKDMKTFRLHDAEDHISGESIGKGGKITPEGSILLLVRGMTLHNDVPICVTRRAMAFNQDLKAIRPKPGVDANYLAYWLLAKKSDLLAAVDHAGHGTGRLVTDRLKKMPIALPTLAEQKRIANILGTLDDKIELNRRKNATLKAMARALFQSWFVDFDPVRRNNDGGESRPEDAFFPDLFEDSQIGEIPKGWTVKPLDKIADYQNGLALQKFRPAENEDPLPIVKIAQLKTGEPTWDEVASPSINPACIVDTGDVVFSWSGSLVVTVWCGGRAALNQHLFKVTSQKYPKWFYLHWTQKHLDESKQVSLAEAIRNLEMLGWVKLQFSESLPVPT